MSSSIERSRDAPVETRWVGARLDSGSRLRSNLARHGRLKGKDTRITHPHITLVVARADNGVIGRDGTLPWRIPDDLKRFKALTLGAPMIMGRKTFDSLPGLLPGRRHIVLTRDIGWQAEGAEVAHSIDAALALVDGPRVSIIGGAEIYALFLPRADRIELTEVHQDVAGDTVLPALTCWRETVREDHEGYSFVTLECGA